jgi:hypothetical protein
MVEKNFKNGHILDFANSRKKIFFYNFRNLT